jgi:3-hydroxyacyl-CoA dehydrogenase
MNNVKVRHKVVGLVSLWDILEYIGFSDEEVEAIADYGFGVQFGGTATYTLIGNNFALDCIIEGLFSYYDELQLSADKFGEPSRSAVSHIYTREEVTEKFWQVVGEDDYINLESH